jgi:hypothetical protein
VVGRQSAVGRRGGTLRGVPARVGLTFWPGHARRRPRSRSLE